MPKLTAKQQLFVEEYLKDLNATQAAIRAGYAPKGAEVRGSELLSNRKVANAVDAAKRVRSERTGVDSDWLLNRLAEETQADIADLYFEEGGLKPVHQWPEIWRKGLVAGVDVEQRYTYQDGEKVPDGVITKIKLSDRVKRLELIGRHIAVGAFKEHEIKLPGSINVTVNRPSGD